MRDPSEKQMLTTHQDAMDFFFVRFYVVFVWLGNFGMFLSFSWRLTLATSESREQVALSNEAVMHLYYS